MSEIACDCAVIGAGVIGLAVAHALAGRGWSVAVVEQADRIGSGISSRSSEVMHAGLYDAPGSLKASTCVEGRRRLEDYCRRRGIAFRRCGKLVVATEAEQLPALDVLYRRAKDNGVEDPHRLEAAEARRLEPALRVAGALWSPSSGIVDSHGLMQALREDAEAAGAIFQFRAPLDRAIRTGRGFRLQLGGAAGYVLLAHRLVNAAGLGAPAVARAIDAVRPASIPALRLAKGSYFRLAERAPFQRLIYPLPARGGLGIHLTLDRAGQARFGPDVEFVDREDYQVDPARAAAFARAIRHYWPQLPANALRPDYAAIRPKLSKDGADFLIQTETDHGCPGLVNLYGIESPGLTAALALAPRIADALDHPSHRS